MHKIILHFSVAIACGAAAVSSCFAQTGGAVSPGTAEGRGYVLEMERAYAKLTSIDQTTTYESDEPGASGITNVRLMLQRPNRLFLEMTGPSGTGNKQSVRRIQCDGKYLYSYDSAQGLYTRDPAGHDFAGFRTVAPTLELAAISGAAPFTRILQAAASVVALPDDTVAGAAAHVVRLVRSLHGGTDSITLYVGCADHLLHKFTVDSVYTAKKPVAEDADNAITATAPATPAFQRTSHLTYVNSVSANPRFDKQTFAWVAPRGAWLSQRNPNAYLDQRQGSARRKASGLTPTDLSHPTDPTDLSAPTRYISASDLLKKAQRNRVQH